MSWWRMTKYLMIINKLQYLRNGLGEMGAKTSIWRPEETLSGVCACSDKMEGKGVNMLMSTNWKPLVKASLMYYR